MSIHQVHGKTVRACHFKSNSTEGFTSTEAATATLPVMQNRHFTDNSQQSRKTLSLLLTQLFRMGRASSSLNWHMMQLLLMESSWLGVQPAHRFHPDLTWKSIPTQLAQIEDMHNIEPKESKREGVKYKKSPPTLQNRSARNQRSRLIAN